MQIMEIRIDDLSIGADQGPFPNKDTGAIAGNGDTVVHPHAVLDFDNGSLAPRLKKDVAAQEVRGRVTAEVDGTFESNRALAEELDGLADDGLAFDVITIGKKSKLGDAIPLKPVHAALA